jgi:hypothetical protein
VDINADGRLDLYLCYSGALPPQKRANQLFINMGNDSQGQPHFEEKAEQYGLASTAFSNQSYFLDYDRDGDLDMLLLNHNPKNTAIQNVQATAELLKGDSPDKGLRLFRQEGGRFTDVTPSSGINGSELSYGLGISISDFNDDGWPDFYVSNDYTVPDYLYINNGDGSFRNDLQKCIGHTSQFSMGNDAGDINNDGTQDLFTLDMLPEDNRRQKLLSGPDNHALFEMNVRSGFYYQYMRNMLHVNNGNGTFSETGQLAGVSNTDWSWAALLADYNNDGWKDLFVSNGYLRDYTNQDFLYYMNNYVQEKGRLRREDVLELVEKMPSSNVTNYIFENKGSGSFRNQTATWGLSEVSNSNGAVYADLDNDGDLDLVVNNINQPAFIYRNEARQQGGMHYLQVRLTGEGGNTFGLGAKVQIFSGGQMQVLEQQPARGYLSSLPPVLHFGLGKKTALDSLVVTWPRGKVQKLYNVKGGTTVHLEEKAATEGASGGGRPQPLFAEVPSPIPFKDSGSVFNDFNRQPQLLAAFSQAGPAMASADLNGDGLEDVVIGGPGGQPAALYLQQQGGRFARQTVPAFMKDKDFDDAGLALFDANGDGHTDLYMASGGYGALQPADPLLQDRLYLNDGKGGFRKSAGLPSLPGSKSCVRAGDINGDGFPDLFVGGRVVPGRYPEAPRSYLLVNDGKGNFSDRTQSLCPELLKPGMVTDAAWADLDGDRSEELVVVGEWMPVLIFSREKGRLVPAGRFLDSSYAGWWNAIHVSDLNKDGRPDLVLGNMGLNTQFRASGKEPLELYYKDFDGNGSVDPIFSFYIQNKRYPYLTRDELLLQLPSLRKRFPDFKSYADVTTDALFPAGELQSAGHLSAGHMPTTLLLSGAGGKLRPAALPGEVQYAPVYAIHTLDYNTDGNPDLLVCGNNRRFKLRLGRFDANYGMLLRGNGKGGFSYVPQHLSGFNIWGDVRHIVRINDVLYFGINGGPVAAYAPSRKK